MWDEWPRRTPHARSSNADQGKIGQVVSGKAELTSSRNSNPDQTVRGPNPGSPRCHRHTSYRNASRGGAHHDLTTPAIPPHVYCSPRCETPGHSYCTVDIGELGHPRPRPALLPNWETCLLSIGRTTGIDRRASG